MRFARALAVASCAILLALAALPLTVSAALDGSALGTAPGRFNSIKCADIDADGNMEIITGNYDGWINVVEFRDGGYRMEWRSALLEYRLWGIELGDADNDGDLDIVAGGGHGHIYVFDGKSHELIATSGELGRDAHGIKIADVNGDKANEIVVGGGYKTDVPHGRIYVLSLSRGRFTELYKDADIAREYDAKIRGIAVADIDRDGVMEIIAGSGVALGEKPGEGYVRIYSGSNGSLEWISPDTNGDVEGLVVMDTDGDGSLEITGGNGYRYFQGYAFQYRYKGAGGVGKPPVYEQVWFSDNIGPKAFGLAVGDIDGDNTPELVLGNQPGYLWVFDGATRRVEWKSELLGSDILGIAIADIDKDGTTEIIAGQGGYQGKADFTSAYTDPHIFIIDGKTKTIEGKLGEPDYLELGLQALVLCLLIVLLAQLSLMARRRREAMSK